MRGGFIKIHRRILDWEWYEDTNMVRVFIHLIVAANYEDQEYQGVLIRRGQLVTGRRKLSAKLGLSEKVIRNTLKKLEKGQQIDIKRANKYSIITVCEYDSYQGNEHRPGPAKGQRMGSERAPKRATYKEDKEIEEVKNKEKVYKKKFIPPSVSDVKEYFQQKGFREEIAVKAFEYYELGNWKDSRGNQVKNWKQKMFTNWMKPEYRIQEDNTSGIC